MVGKRESLFWICGELKWKCRVDSWRWILEERFGGLNNFVIIGDRWSRERINDIGKEDWVKKVEDVVVWGILVFKKDLKKVF